MKIRKLLHWLTIKQKAVIAADIEHILSGCDSIAKVEWHEQLENQKTHDGQCPKCQAHIEHIVDKIRHVQGTGKVDGSIKIFNGYILGNVTIDTNEVNHCNKCGNEWKKSKTKYISKTPKLYNVI